MENAIIALKLIDVGCLINKLRGITYTEYFLFKWYKSVKHEIFVYKCTQETKPPAVWLSLSLDSADKCGFGSIF